MSDEAWVEPRVRRREYKTIAGRKRAEKRYGSRVQSIGTTVTKGVVRHQLWVYDLDEWGQPPEFVCPACGQVIEDGGEANDG